MSGGERPWSFGPIRAKVNPAQRLTLSKPLIECPSCSGGYSASIVYCPFMVLGLDVTAEQTTSHGRTDLVGRFVGWGHVIRIKVRGYPEKFAGQPA